MLRLDPALDELLPADAEFEKLASGFEFTEGPVWMPGRDGRLFLSDIPGNKLTAGLNMTATSSLYRIRLNTDGLNYRKH